MKNKNRPKRQKPKLKPGKREKERYFNPWICKYFDLSGRGIEAKRKEDDRSE